MILRASSLPLIELCQASAIPPAIVLRSGGKPATTGTATHEVMVAIVRNQPLDLEAVSEKYQVEMKELSILAWSGRRVWNAVADNFPDPIVEEPIEWTGDVGGVEQSVWLSGHPDVVSLVGNQLNILDWKTGRLEDDHDAQLKGYAYLCLQNFPEAERVWLGVARLRAQEVIPVGGKVWSRAEIESWWEGLAGSLFGPEKFNPGRWCGHCPRGHECPAKEKLLWQMTLCLTIFQAPTEERRLVFGYEAIGQLYDAVKILTPFLEKALDLVRAEVEAAGGSLPLGDGRELVLVQQEKRTINFAIGEPLLRDALAENLPQAIQVGITKVSDLVRARNSRGQKKAAVDRLMEELDAAGAITTTTFTKLELRRVPLALVPPE